MAEKFEIEEFNTTEIDIEQVKKSDEKDDWEFVSVFEADTYSVPFHSVPKMHEAVDGSDAICFGSGLESDTQGDFSHPMNERKDEVNKEQSPAYQHYEESEKLIDEAKEVKFFPLLCEQKCKEIEKELDEAMQDLSSQEKDCDEEVRLAIDEVMKDYFQIVEENNAVGTKASTVIQDVLQKVQENEKLKSKIQEAMIETIGEKANAVTQENTDAGSSAQYMKSQTRAIESESAAKAKTESGCQVVQRELIETFNKNLEFNTVMPDKISTGTATDKFEKDRLQVKNNQSEMESLINEELNNSSAEESKKYKKTLKLTRRLSCSMFCLIYLDKNLLLDTLNEF